MINVPILWIVIPCYNEQKVLPITAPLFLGKLRQLISLGKISDESRILFVDDGSGDETWSIIKGFSEEDPHYLGIRQSRNRGHQSSLVAGLMEAKEHCDITISIDCDGQDDINAMDQMVDAYLDGCEVVYGVRSKRETDTWFKRFTAETYYRILKRLGADIVYNHADYRLVSSRVLNHFSDFHEVNVFLRGLFPLIGFKSTCVYYDRKERIAGESHYPLKKMLSLAFDGITSLSVKPIHFITLIGVLTAIMGLVGIIWAVVQELTGKTVAGWASIICIVCFLGGIQLLSLGVIGEYVGKTYLETKKRPLYIIQEKTDALDERKDA